MKKSIYQQTIAIALFLAIFLSGTISQAQDVTGQWNGVLSVQGINMKIIFHINKTGDGYITTMDSPNQGAAGIPVAATAFDGSKLSLAAPNLGLLYEGEFKTDSVVGTFKQGTLSVPMTLKKEMAEVKPVVYLHDEITGQWNGALSTNLRIVFHINKTEKGYTSTMDSPDQGAVRIPITATSFDGSKLSLTVSNIVYEGEFKIDSIVGTFKQGAISFPMILKRTPEEVKPVVRPQEPKPPFPYRSEDVVFENKGAGITLAGTLTMPSSGSNFTAVILITGSGPQNRDEEIMGHKPFLVIADYLTRRGIAVLRYDDRGTAQSTGNFSAATTADFAADVESAIAYLKTRKEINPSKIGLMGHSEGGIIAPMVAARSKDVSFIVMLAGAGIRGDALLLKQTELIARASGLSEEKIAKSRGLNSVIYAKIVNSKEIVTLKEMTDFMTSFKDDLAEFVSEGMNTDDFIKMSAAQMTSPWMQGLLRYDPAPTLEQVKCPVLAVNGSLDLQVPAKENLSAISAALKKGGNKNVTVKEYPNLNHLFQECTTGSPAEYAIIEQTFSPEVLKDLGDWILNN